MATSHEVYLKLKRWIYRGKLQPGQRLVETQLASQVGTSRIPLRESLRRLETEGLVHSIPYKATYVAELSETDIREIFMMRHLLEPPAARLASQHAQPRQVARMRRLAEQMGQAARANQRALLHQVDYRFHHAIVQAADSPRLLRAYESCHIEIVGPRVGYRDLQWETGDLIEQLHLELVEHIAAGRGRQAERYARNVLEQSMAVMDEYLQTTDELRRPADP